MTGLFPRARMLLAVVLLGVMFAGACSSDSSESAETSEPAGDTDSGDTGDEAEPAESNDEPFVWMVPSDPNGLDPHLHSNVVGIQVRNQLFDPLISRDVDGALEPALAESWERIDADLWEFTLRTDVEFTNGEPFDAETVVYNVERARDHESSLWKTHFAPITEVEVVSDNVVRLHTDGSYSILANQLSFLLMVPPVYTEEAGENFEQEPVGTGAYIVEEWVKDDHFSLVANEDYWRGAPAIKNVTIRVVPDENTQVAELLAGGADLSLNLPPAMRDQLEGDDDLVVTERGIARAAIMDIQADEGILADVRVRQAIAHAIDVDGMLQTLQGGLGQRITSAVTPAMFGYDGSLEPYEHNPEESRRLLEEAGWDSSTVVPLFASGSFISNSTSVLDQVIADLDAVGISVEPFYDEGFSTLVQKFADGTANGIRLWTIGGLFDAGQMIEVLYNSESIYGQAGDEELNVVISEALTIVDDDERAAAYADLQARIQEEYRAVPLWEVRLLVGYSNDYDVAPRADQTVRLAEITPAG